MEGTEDYIESLLAIIRDYPNDAELLSHAFPVLNSLCVNGNLS